MIAERVEELSSPSSVLGNFFRVAIGNIQHGDSPTHKLPEQYSPHSCFMNFKVSLKGIKKEKSYLSTRGSD